MGSRLGGAVEFAVANEEQLRRLGMPRDTLELEGHVVVDGRRDLSLLNYGKRTMKQCVTAPEGDFRRGNLIRDWGRQVVHAPWDGRPH